MARCRLGQIHTGLFRNLPESYDQVLKTIKPFEQLEF